MLTTVNLDGLHRLCSFNRRAVLASGRVGCFYCLGYSSPKDIKEWVDSRKVQPSLEGKVRLTSEEIKKAPEITQGQTPLCPICGIDAILPEDTYGFKLTDELLQAMHAQWFSLVR